MTEIPSNEPNPNDPDYGDVSLPEGFNELRRITIIQYLSPDGDEFISERYDSKIGEFSATEKLGMLELAKVTVMAPMLASYPMSAAEEDEEDANDGGVDSES